MWWKRGFLLNTLNYNIEKNLKESIYCNQSFLGNKWNLFERQVIKWAGSPGQYVILLIIAFMLNMICIYLWLPDIRIHIHKWNQPWGDLVNWQSVILATQLTIIGLIFPLVLGFVGLLLNNKTANKALWTIYSKYSGFMFVGFSSLLLSGIIIIGQYVHPWLSYSDDIIFSIGISVWFLFNISLLGWFLYSTFEFISNDNRKNILLRYCINEALVDEVKARLSELIPGNAAEIGLIPRNIDNDDQPVVTTFYYARDKDNKYTFSYQKRKYLKNIYFRLLSVYVRYWKRISLFLSTGEEKVELALPVSGKAKSDFKWTIALSTNPLSIFSKFFLWLCYSFSKNSDLEVSNMKPIINALINDIDDALRENNIRLFKISINEMEDWHSQILSTSSFKNDSGEWDNWLLLGDGSFGNRTLLNILSGEYYELSLVAVKKISESNRFYEAFCNFYLHIYIHKNIERLAVQVTKELITNHYYLFTALVSWHKNVDKSEESTKEQYDNSLISFVGSWENWPTWLGIKEEKKGKSLQSIDQHMHHLVCSARLLINALRHQDIEAATWSADILNNWYAKVFSGSKPFLYDWNNEFLVHTLLSQNIENPIWLQIHNNNNFNDIDATKLAISNTWFDVRMVAAAYITNKPVSTLTPEIINIIFALIKGDRLKESGGVARARVPIRDGSNILEIFIRQSWYWEYSENSYGSWLDSVVESFGRIEARRYVSGRVYTGWGSSDVRHLKNSYMVFAIMYSQREWGISTNVMKFLFSNVVELNHRETLIRDLEEWLAPSEAVIEKVKCFIVADDIDKLLLNYKASLNAVIDNIRNQNNQHLIGEPIDNLVLGEIGKCASKSGFTDIVGLIPQRLFDDIEYVDVLDDSKKITQILTDFDRQYVTEGADLNGYDGIVDEIISSSISINIFRRLITGLPFSKEVSGPPQILLNNILVDIELLKNKNYQPVMFVGSHEVQQFLDAALWGLDDELDSSLFDIRRDDGYPESYMCHINNIEVYSLPFNDAEFSLLIAKDCFNYLEFRRIGDGVYVDVEFVEEENDASKGELKLSYWMNENFRLLDGYKYITKLSD